jgi:hypothetical protein
MGLNDRPGNGEPHAHAAAVAGIQGLEDVRDPVRRNPGAAIRHADLHFPIVDLVHVDGYAFVVSIARATTPHRVLQEIDQDQLNLQGVGDNRGKITDALPCDVETPVLGLWLHHPDNLFEQGIKRRGGQLRLFVVDQRPDALRDGTRPLRLPLDLGEKLDELGLVFDIALEASLGRLRVVLDRDQRLIDLILGPSEV